MWVFFYFFFEIFFFILHVKLHHGLQQLKNLIYAPLYAFLLTDGVDTPLRAQN